jgi:hypothetical protein
LVPWETTLSDKPNELVEVRVKMPAELRDELTTFCARTNLEFDAVVCYEMKRWLLAQTITLLEGAGEGEEGRPFKPRL